MHVLHMYDRCAEGAVFYRRGKTSGPGERCPSSSPLHDCRTVVCQLLPAAGDERRGGWYIVELQLPVLYPQQNAQQPSIPVSLTQ